MSEHSGASYDSIAGKYARNVDTSPHNALYERPATLSLLPRLAGATVLDAGCGPGWYAAYLLSQGAVVTAIDYNAEFVALTRARVGARATVFQADLTEPLRFAGDGQFDLIVCPLVMHYLREWTPTLREFHRVLQPHGVLVFSTHHPFMDWQQFEQEDYFAVTLLEDEWRDVGKRLLKRGKDLAEFKSVITQLLEAHELAVHYRDHPLVGQYKGTRECHIAPDWLLIYEMTDTEVILIRTGTHSDLFA